MASNKEIDKYREMLLTLGDEKWDFPITNTGAEHASEFISRMFKMAQKEALIFTKDIPLSIGSTLVREAISAADRGVKINIIVDGSIDYNSNIYRLIYDLLQHKSQLDIRSASQDFKLAVISSYKALNYFQVVDQVSYRREYDPNNYTAVANFNDPEKASELTTLFKQYFKDLPKAI